MKMQDLISEISKFDPDLEIVSYYDPTEFVISFDYEMTDNESDYYDFVF